MNGFIHIYARGKEPKTDEVVIRFDKVNIEAYDAKLHSIHLNQLHKNIYEKDEQGHLKHQGNLGVLKVSPTLPDNPSLEEFCQLRATDFIGQFSEHQVEFTLSDNVQIVPTYGLHYKPRESFTTIKFQQYDHGHDCYHEVLLSTKEGALNFSVVQTETPQRIKLHEWAEIFKTNDFDVEMVENYVDVNRELLLEDIFHSVTEEALVSTEIGRAFDPTFRVLPMEAHVNQPVPDPVEEPEQEIKVGELMMLVTESEDGDVAIYLPKSDDSDDSDEEVPSEHDSDIDVGADPITQKYISSTNALKRRLAEECQLDMHLAPPVYNTLIDSASIGIIQTPDLLKQPELPIQMSALTLDDQ